MKKILMTAAIAISCLAVKAQDVTSVTSPSLTFALNLDDIITLSLVDPADLGTTNFSSPAMYNNTVWATATPLGHITFNVSSNRMYDVTTSLASITWSQNGHAYDPLIDVNTVMPSTVIGYNSAYWDPTDNTSATVWHQASVVPFAAYGTPQAFVTDGAFGTASSFDLAMHAMPGWLYTGGSYAGIFTVTATQK